MKPFRLKPPPMPKELIEQRTLIKWVELRKATFPELELLFAIPNGGARDVVTGAQLKASGARRGVPDLCLPVARGGFHGLYLELKRRGSGVVSAEQKWWLDRLQKEGYRAVVCYGWLDARQIIEGYLGAVA